MFRAQQVTCDGNESNGKLDGRSGTFALQHNGSMTRGKPELIITVVPDSGTGELTGLTGRMTIDIVEGKHYYKFDYTLAKNQIEVRKSFMIARYFPHRMTEL
jgi:hypothetical protein